MAPLPDQGPRQALLGGIQVAASPRALRARPLVGVAAARCSLLFVVPLSRTYLSPYHRPRSNMASSSSSDAPTATVVATPDPEAVAESERIKLLANKEFVSKNYVAAIELYSQAIDKNPANAILFANRSACHLAIENYGTAIADATTAIELDPTYQKGYYRRGAAHAAMAKYKLALDDFRELVRIAPGNKEARARLKACETAYRRELFQQAIASANSTPPSERIDLGAIVVDPSYTGLHLPETLTPEWVESLMDSFVDQKKLHIKYCYMLLVRAKEIFKAQPTVVDITVPEGGHITVFGDVHGQYYDLVNILRNHSGLPSPTNPVVFNGDLVDRGSWSLEVILLLLAYKVLYPEHVHIARGNHETKNMNMVYGFSGEVKAKYNSECMEVFSEIFCYLPLVHLINGKVFITHGGLFSQDDVTLEQLRKINRFQEPPDRGLMSELLWSDPRPGTLTGRVQSKRGVGIEFGVDVTTRFCEQNGLDLVVRSHEVRQEGYSVEHNGKLITVFSAPNYCDQAGNKGAIIRFDSNMKPTFVTFGHVPHPSVRPMQYANDYQSLVM